MAFNCCLGEGLNRLYYWGLSLSSIIDFSIFMGIYGISLENPGLHGVAHNGMCSLMADMARKSSDDNMENLKKKV